MKILFFSDHFYPEPSAPAAHVYERAIQWVRAGHDVSVVCSAPNFPEGRVYEGYRNAWRAVEVLEGVRVIRVKTFISANEGMLRRSLDYISYMLSAWFFSFFESKPNVIISSSPHLLVPLAGVAASICRRIPHVFEIRDLWPASIAATDAVRGRRVLQLLEKLELWLYRRSSRIIALTPSFRADLSRRGVPVEKIDVVINGANLSLFRPVSDKDTAILAEYRLENRFVVGYLGTIGLAHGLQNVLDAAERLRGTNISFFIVGVGAAKKDLERRAEEAGLENVVFAPRQLKEQMLKFWSVCDASLVHLKNDRVFSTVIPSKIFESMAVGLPIVYAVPDGDGSAIVRKHGAGVIVPPMDPDALAEAISQLAIDEGLRQQLARNSAEAASCYSRDKQALESLAVLTRVVEQPV